MRPSVLKHYRRVSLLRELVALRHAATGLSRRCILIFISNTMQIHKYMYVHMCLLSKKGKLVLVLNIVYINTFYLIR